MHGMQLFFMNLTWQTLSTGRFGTLRIAEAARAKPLHERGQEGTAI
jgi:hypothetical protein